MSYRATYSSRKDRLELNAAVRLQVATILITVVLLAVCGVITEFAGLLRQPGTSWNRGLLTGTSLRLLDSGRYVWLPYCEFCHEETAIVGIWRKAGEKLLLSPEGALSSSITLVQRVIGTCDVLMEERHLAEGNPFSSFVREGDDCEFCERDPSCPDEL